MSEKSLGEEIIEVLKEEGLDLAEDAAGRVVKAGLKIAKLAVLRSENKVDDMLVPVLALVEPKILALVDKIDGKEG